MLCIVKKINKSGNQDNSTTHSYKATKHTRSKSNEDTIIISVDMLLCFILKNQFLKFSL